MKNLVLLFTLLAVLSLRTVGQELFIYSEPASNMPSKTIGLKFTGLFPQTAGISQRYKPEIMFGINKNWMVHLSTSFSDYYSSALRYESVKAYAKYRFYSADDVHKHFRMAAFADISITRSPYTYDEMTLEGDNSGAQVGVIATKLVNKFALSATAAYTGFFPENKFSMHNGERSLNMTNYSLSMGYLVLPREYIDYNQTNFNVYLETLAMKSLDNRSYAIDLAPAVQLIFNSNTKLNAGYRFQLRGNMSRISQKTWLIGFEHTLFNAWK